MPRRYRIDLTEQEIYAVGVAIENLPEEGVSESTWAAAERVVRKLERAADVKQKMVMKHHA